MPALPFIRQHYFKVMDTGKEMELGSFVFAADCDLAAINFPTFFSSLISGSFTVNLNVYSSPLRGVPVYTLAQTFSAAALIPTQTSPWFGIVPWNFPSSCPLNDGIAYYLTMTSTDYARAGDTFYYGIDLDWGYPVNIETSATLAGARAIILVKS